MLLAGIHLRGRYRPVRAYCATTRNGTYCSVLRTQEQRCSEVESIIHNWRLHQGHAAWAGSIEDGVHAPRANPNRWEILVVRQVGGRRMREEAKLVESLVRVELANHWMTGSLDEEWLEERAEPVRSQVSTLVGLDQFQPRLADSFGLHAVRMPFQGRAGMPTPTDTARNAGADGRDLPAPTYRVADAART